MLQFRFAHSDQTALIANSIGLDDRTHQDWRQTSITLAATATLAISSHDHFCLRYILRKVH